MSDHTRELELLTAFDAPTIANAIESLQIRDGAAGYTGADVRCLFPELGPMLGYAVTVLMDSTTPGQAKGTTRDMLRLWELVKQSMRPSVLAFQHVDHDLDRSCAFGDINAAIALKLGTVGLVTNAGVRDIDQVEALKFHYFARGAVVAHGNYHLLSVGDPVRISGMEVRTGDLIYGDVNGVVAVPQNVSIRDLIRAAEEGRHSEAALLNLIGTPAFELDQLRTFAESTDPPRNA